MESMAHIPGASRWLVHRAGFLGWLMIQWDQTSFQLKRGAAEERGRYLALLEQAVVACVAGEVERAKGSQIQELPDGKSDVRKEDCDGEKEDGGQSRWPKAWVVAASALVSRAIEDSGKSSGDRRRHGYKTR
jgi:hypothetical protein